MNKSEQPKPGKPEGKKDNFEADPDPPVSGMGGEVPAESLQKAEEQEEKDTYVIPDDRASDREDRISNKIFHYSLVGLLCAGIASAGVVGYFKKRESDAEIRGLERDKAGLELKLKEENARNGNETAKKGNDLFVKVEENYNKLNGNLGSTFIEMQRRYTGFNKRLSYIGKNIQGSFDETKKNVDSVLEGLKKYADELKTIKEDNKVQDLGIGEQGRDIQGIRLDVNKLTDIVEKKERTENKVTRTDLIEPKSEDSYKIAEPPVEGPRQRDAIEDWAYARHFNNNNYTDAQLKESPITTLLNKPIRPDLKGYGAEPLGFVADGVQLPFEGVAYVAGQVPILGDVLEKPFKWSGRLTSSVVRAVPFFGRDSTYLVTHPSDAMTKNTGPSIETIIDDIAIGLFIGYLTRDHDHKRGGGNSGTGSGVNIPGGPVDW